MRLRLLTLNIHKGFSSYLRRNVLHELREAIRHTHADLVFLQEVAWRDGLQQSEFLADQVWTDHAYGRNAVFDDRHHGNAILSRFNFQTSMNTDISSSLLERRGFLYGSLFIENKLLHVISLHLSLTKGDRKTQADAIYRFASGLPENEPLIIAGDFNDWTFRMRDWLESRLHMKEAHRHIHGREARTFPSYFPFLSLDRIYTRGLQIHSANRFADDHWPKLSDHLGLMAEVELL